MKQNLLKRIWIDPVWSKVISAILIAIGTTIFISIKSYYQEKSFNEALNEILALKLDLKTILLIVILILIIYLLLSAFRFKYSDSTKKSDIDLFNTIRNTYLDQDNTIRFLREFNFRGAFDTERIAGLDDFIDKCKNSDFKFHNPQLEKLKIQMLKEGEVFQEIVAMKTFPEGRLNRVPREWEQNNNEEFNKAINGMNNAANKIVAIYDKLILKGRKDLEI